MPTAASLTRRAGVCAKAAALDAFEQLRRRRSGRDRVGNDFARPRLQQAHHEGPGASFKIFLARHADVRSVERKELRTGNLEPIEAAFLCDEKIQTLDRVRNRAVRLPFLWRKICNREIELQQGFQSLSARPKHGARREVKRCVLCQINAHSGRKLCSKNEIIAPHDRAGDGLEMLSRHQPDLRRLREYLEYATNYVS